MMFSLDKVGLNQLTLKQRCYLTNRHRAFAASCLSSKNRTDRFVITAKTKLDFNSQLNCTCLKSILYKSTLRDG